MFVLWMTAAMAAVDVDERYAVDDPAVHGELALYPVVDRQVRALPEGDFASMAEAMEAKTLAISELDSSGSVPTLRATNSGKRTVLLLAGEVITGGKQDRVVVADTLVPPGKTVDFDVNCVEQGRWSASNQGLSFGYGGKAELGLKQTVSVEKNQSATWSKVEELNTAKRAKVSDDAALAPATGTYRASLQAGEVSAAADAAVKELAPVLASKADVVGLVVAVDGEILGTEIFGHPALFERHRDDLVRGFALDAASDPTDDRPGVPETDEAATFVRQTLTAPEALDRAAEHADDWAFEGEAVEGRTLKSKDGRTIHKGSYKKK